jgi:hypothetical protein
VKAIAEDIGLQKLLSTGCAEQEPLTRVPMCSLTVAASAVQRSTSLPIISSWQFGNGCATYKWKLSRPAFLPIVFKPIVEMRAA